MHQFRTIFQDNLLIAASPDNDAKSPKLFWALPQYFETQNQACSKMMKDYISNIFLRLISWYFLFTYVNAVVYNLRHYIFGVRCLVRLCPCRSQDSWRHPLFHFLYFFSLFNVGQVASTTISFFVSCIFSFVHFFNVFVYKSSY